MNKKTLIKTNLIEVIRAYQNHFNDYVNVTDKDLKMIMRRLK